MSSHAGPARAAPSEPDDAAADLLAAVERLAFAAVGVTERAIAASAAAELSLPQWRVLTILAASSRALRLADLAVATGLSAPSASRMVARLAGRGLVVSSIDLRDRRAIRLRVTAEGRRVVRAVVDARSRELAETLADADLPRSAAAVLDRVASALEGSGRPD